MLFAGIQDDFTLIMNSLRYSCRVEEEIVQLGDCFPLTCLTLSNCTMAPLGG